MKIFSIAKANSKERLTLTASPPSTTLVLILGGWNQRNRRIGNLCLFQRFCFVYFSVYNLYYILYYIMCVCSLGIVLLYFMLIYTR